MKARLLLAAAVSIVLVPLGAGAAQASTSSAPSGHDCHVSAAWINNGSGPSVQITETGTGCDTSDVVSLKLWWTTSLDGNPISDQHGIELIRDGSMAVGVYVDPIPLVADGSCFWQLDLAWGHAPLSLETPYGSRLIQAWHGGTTDCLTQPTTPPATTPPAPSSPPVTTTPAPVPSATVTTQPPTAAPTTSAVPTPAPTTSHKPKPPVVHHKPKPKPKPTHHHKPSPKPTPSTPPVSASGCVGSGCDTPSPAPTTHKPVPPALPYTGTPTGLLLGLAAGLIVAGTTVLLVLRSHP